MKYVTALFISLMAANAYAQNASADLTKQLQKQQDASQQNAYLEKREQTRLLQQQQQEQQQAAQMQRQQQNLDSMHYSTDRR